LGIGWKRIFNQKIKVAYMSKIIAGRYIIQTETDTIAEDRHSTEGDVVQIKRWKRQRLDDIIHNIFLRRAKEFTSIKETAVVPLIDFGFDGPNSYYYVVYKWVGGVTQLSKLLKDGALPIHQTIIILLGVIDSLKELHLNNFYGGIFNPPQIFLSGDLSQPKVLLNMAGLEGFELLLGVAKDRESRNFIYEDITQLGYLATTMLTRNKEPNEEIVEKLTNNINLPIPFVTFLKRSILDNKNPYLSLSEAQRDLKKALNEIQSETTYHVVPIKSVAQKLLSLGFIQKDEIYVAVEFLNNEFKSENYIQFAENKNDPGNASYSITTQRFRMFCKPLQGAEKKALAIISIDCPSPTSLVSARETGMSISATLKAVLQTTLPPNADILPLLDQVREHQLVYQQIKNKRLGEKSGFEAWQKVIALQKRLIDEFKLAYGSTSLDNDHSTLTVNLRESHEVLDISEDERLMISTESGKRSIPVGYFQELDGDRLKISLLSNINVDEIAQFGFVTRDNIQAKSILSRQEDAMRKLKFKESLNTNLLSVLLNPTELQYEKNYSPEFWDDGLSDDQKEAVKKALGVKDIFLVHGPPGTGKTRTIVEIIRQIINDSSGKDQKILMTSQSNVAVNHALSALLEKQPGLRDMVVRVGREEKAGETGELLLDAQLLRWSEDVQRRSSEFTEKLRSQFDIKPQLAECFSLIDECERAQKELQDLQKQIAENNNKFQLANQELSVLNGLMTKTENLRKESSALLEKIDSRDLEFVSILEIFDKNYLGWATEFLAQANELSKLSARRADIQDSINSLKAFEGKRKSDFEAANGLIHETLQGMFKVDLRDLISQKKYINEKLSSQQDAALKLGRVQKIQQDWCQRISRGVSDFEGAYLSHCKIIGATCIGVAAKGEVGDIEFDWVIVDEAGRSTHPELVVPLVRGRKIILVGDHMQLPPIVDKDLSEDLLEEIEVLKKDLETSLFKELIQPENGLPPKTQSKLKVQYRMNREIGELISQCFYEGDLRHGESVSKIEHKQKWINTPIVWFDTKNIKNHEEKKVGSSYQNLVEAEAIKSILAKLETDLASQNLRRTVGVITGYMGQKRLLRQQLGRISDSWPHLSVEINTVDAYQGQEKDYIVYSVVRSNSNNKIGFLQDKRRLNVALSRARELLIIIGDTETVEFANTSGRDNPFYKVLNFIKDHNASCTLREYTL